MGLQRVLPLALLSCAMGRQRARALAVRGGDKVPLRGGFAYGGQKKPVFYDMTHSNNAARVRLWLRLVDPTLSSQVDSTFITYDDLRSEEYGKLNPLRKVPALVRGDGGTVFESDVILKYLAVWNSNVGRPTPSTRNLTHWLISTQVPRGPLREQRGDDSRDARGPPGHELVYQNT